MTESVRLLFFAGSTRQASYNRKLAHCAHGAALAKGLSADLIELSDYPMPIYNGDAEAKDGPPENARKLMELMRGYQGIFIASPEYNASVTPLLKNTLDWVSRVRDPADKGFDVYRSRVFALGAASPGQFGGMRSLLSIRQVLAVGLGAMVLPDQIAVPNAASAFDENGVLTNERSRTQLDTVIVRLADIARRFRS
jgi:NAD(P)H-dependent FMN reductase